MPSGAGVGASPAARSSESRPEAGRTASFMPDSALGGVNNLEIRNSGGDHFDISSTTHIERISASVVNLYSDSAPNPIMPNASGNRDPTPIFNELPHSSARANSVVPPDFSPVELLKDLSNELLSVLRRQPMLEESGAESAQTCPESPIRAIDFDDLPTTLQAYSSSSGPHPAEIYVCDLMSSGYGLPCWDPRPHQTELQPRGVTPGDVGTYTAKGGFRKLFNLWEVQAAIKEMAASMGCSSSSAYVPLGGTSITHRSMISEGTMIAPGAVCSAPPPPPPSQQGVVHEFSFPSSAGGILVVLSAADLEEIDDKEAMRNYVAQYAESIYRFATKTRPFKPGDPLYFITGSIKTNESARAAYKPHEAHVRLLQLSRTPQFTHRWTLQPPSTNSHYDSNGTGDLKNQALFLQGFKLAVSSEFVHRIQAVVVTELGQEEHPPTICPTTQNRSDESGPSMTSNASQDNGGGGSPPNSTGGPVEDEEPRSEGRELGVGTSESGVRGTQEVAESRFGSGDQFGFSNFPPLSENVGPANDECEIEAPTRVPLTYHPSDVINELLMNTAGTDFALTHDDDWRHAFRDYSTEGAAEMLSPSYRRSRAGDPGKFLPRPPIVVQNGVAFMSEGSPPLSFPTGPEPVPVFVWVPPTEWRSGIQDPGPVPRPHEPTAMGNQEKRRASPVRQEALNPLQDWEKALDSEFLSTAQFLMNTIALNKDLGPYLIFHAVRTKTGPESPFARLDSRQFYEYARTIYRIELERTIIGYRPSYPPDNQKARQRASQLPREGFKSLLADIIFEHAKRRLKKIPWKQFQARTLTLEEIFEGQKITKSTLVPCIKSLMTLACKEQLEWEQTTASSFSGLFLLYQLILSVTSKDPPPHQVGLFEHLIELEGTEAQVVLNAMQLILDFSVHLGAESNRIAIFKALYRLAGNSGNYPSTIAFSNLKADLTGACSNPIGAGSFGHVCKVKHLGKLLALKVAREGLQRKTFCREVVTWCNLCHENVLPFYGVFSEQGSFTLVSPFMENGNIRSFLRSRYPRVEGPRFSLIAGIISGLQYLHNQGVIHGDLKGDNILVTQNERACLADFGISTIASEGHTHLNMTRPSTARAGTSAYQAPELFNYVAPTATPSYQQSGSSMSSSEAYDNVTKSPLSPKSDVYALGCVCYEIMTMNPPLHHIPDWQVAMAVIKGHRPQKPASNSLAFTNLGLSESFWDLIGLCWRQAPEERPTTEHLLQHYLISPHCPTSIDLGVWDAAQTRQNNIMVGLGLRQSTPDESMSSTYTTERT